MGNSFYVDLKEWLLANNWFFLAEKGWHDKTDYLWISPSGTQFVVEVSRLDGTVKTFYPVE